MRGATRVLNLECHDQGRGGLNLQWNRFEVALDSLRADTSQSLRL